MNTNIETVLAILRDEVNGDTGAALQKMTRDYVMTWMYRSNDNLFPSSEGEPASTMTDIYAIKGRKYEIKNIVEESKVVMVELIESYPDPRTGKLHQTPLVLVLELEDGKIRTGRHYCDPRLSHEELRREDLDTAFKRTGTKYVIE